MGLITPKQRRRMLDFADEIAKLAAGVPDTETKRDLYKAAQSVRRRFGFSESEKKALVRKAIDLGANTFRDLAYETGFPLEIIKEVVGGLERDGKARTERMSLSGHGRPQVLILAAGEV